MRKHLLITAIVMALVMCFSFGALADGITHNEEGDANKYVITEALAQGVDTADLYIGTVKDWKANKSNNFSYVEGRTTFFENGEALHDHDIIITNGKVGAVLAVGTRNPWGYPAGSILDAGTVKDDEANRDTVWSIELLVNGWDSWAPDNCGTVTFDLVKYDFDNKTENPNGLDAVKVTRVYDINDVKFDVTTYYSAADDKDYLYMFDKLVNTTGADTPSLSNRFAMTNKGDDGGSMYVDNAKCSVGSYGVSTTGSTYSTTLMVPGENISSTNDSHKYSRSGGAVGYKEARCNYAWKKDEALTYDEYIIITDEPTTTAANDFFMEYKDVEKRTRVTGTITGLEGTKNDAAVVVKQGDSIYGWFATNDNSNTYEVTIPQDENKYTVYLEQKGCASGEPVAIDNSKDEATANLEAGAPKADITINLKDQNGKLVWGKVEFLGEYPTVRYIGNSVFQAEEKGVIEAEVSDITDFEATVFGEGYYFYSNDISITEKDVKNGAVDVVVDMAYSLPDGWLAADVHHHTNKNDAFALPEDVVKSNLASGLDVVFTTDHDFTTQNKNANDKIVALNDAANAAEINGHIPSEEISCSWAHFNVIPQTSASYDYFMDENAENHVMNQFSKLPEFVKQTHDEGATITANHPWYSYGLFYANDADAIPGGYTDDYDTIEINACCNDSENIKTINSVTDLWNAYATGEKDEAYGEVKKAHYLVSGSDTHDVLYPGVTNDKGSTSYVTYATGKGRTVAYVGAINEDKDASALKENALSYANAVAAGNSYITLGPILEPNVTPGSEISKSAKQGDAMVYSSPFGISIDIKSLSGIQDVIVLSNFGDKTYTYAGKADDAATDEEFTINNVYRVYSADQLGGNANEATLNFTANIPEGESGYFAFMVVDKNEYQMYAITNPYWVQSDAAPAFTDVDPNSWYAPYVETLAAEGIITGYKDGTFRPQNDISRAEFCKLMAGILPKDAPSDKEAKFSDVVEGSWYYDAVMTMAKAGYIQGYGNDTFAPNKEITRAEISTIIYNVFKADLKVNKPDVSFTDVKEGQWFYDAVMALAKAGYVNGKGDDLFAPNEEATRAQAAKFIFVAATGGETILNTVQ